MTLVVSGDLVLPDRIVEGGSLVVDEGRIVEVRSDRVADLAGAEVIDARGALVLPGFVDVHVHGVEGHDTLDEDVDAVAVIASRLPRFGVTAFCPTTVACAPGPLRRFLEQVEGSRRAPREGARVLPAHLESNFINPEFCGAQPLSCLRLPRASDKADADFSGSAILDVIAGGREQVGIITIAPEIDGGLDLVHTFIAAGHRVSIGHSGAGFEVANSAIDAGVRHATHLFNRMPPLGHRSPGLVGAVLDRDEVAVEVICDGHHVHPAVARLAIAAKGVGRVMAITDGTAGSGLAPGSTARLGGRAIHVREHAAVLDDGTLAGSTLTMDRAFATIVRAFGRSIVDAAHLCATTPARELGLKDAGTIGNGAIADLTVLDRQFRVQCTLVGGREVYRRREAGTRQ